MGPRGFHPRQYPTSDPLTPRKGKLKHSCHHSTPWHELWPLEGVITVSTLAAAEPSIQGLHLMFLLRVGEESFVVALSHQPQTVSVGFLGSCRVAAVSISVCLQNRNNAIFNVRGSSFIHMFLQFIRTFTKIFL